tara:strand:+ start:911 stop:1039 length:129 start_codon:yes stop_codon:yes gene_type:complete
MKIAWALFLVANGISTARKEIPKKRIIKIRIILKNARIVRIK